LTEFGQFKQARRLLERAVKVDHSDKAKVRLSLAYTLLEEGDYKNGWREFEVRWRISKQLSPLVNPSVPRWRGEKMARKNILLWYEPWQGLGDEILFLRYALALADRAVREDGLLMLCCTTPLYELFSRSLAGHCNVLSVTTKEKGHNGGWPLQYFRGRKPMQCPIMSLPACTGEIPVSYPYLRPAPEKINAWRQRLSGDKNFKVGFSWTGREDHPRNDLRSVPIRELMGQLKDIPGVTFYSLQLGPQVDLARSAGLVDFTGELKSVDYTAALVSTLDLVIGIDGMISHLAGALNIPTWVMVDSNPYWGWGRRGQTTVWYCSVRIYRQTQMHNWQSVFEQVRNDLLEAGWGA
jgi:hypothetical protein